MRTSGVLALLSTAFLGHALAEDAPVITGNPVGASYLATLPEKPFFTEATLEGNVKGSISAVSGPGGKGVTFSITFENFPKSGGPFIYHIHEKAATNGNCTSTGAHLDPTKRGETPACDAADPASCQVGDLSGKHGKITSDPFTAQYTDEYISTQPGNAAYFGDLSFVIHYANKTRLTCANFSKTSASSNSTSSPTGTGSAGTTAAPTGTGGLTTQTTAAGSPKPTTSNKPFPGAASMNKVSVSLVGAIVAAMVFTL